MVTPDDDDPWCWSVEQPDADRTFGPGCLLVLVVCVLLWIVVVVGAVQLYP